MDQPIAFNIAFIPETAVAHQASELSKHLVDSYQSPYQLGPDGLPHITLLQGVLPNQKAVAAVSEKLRVLKESESYPPLETKGFFRKDESSALWWDIERTQALRHWHEQALAIASPEMVYPDEIKASFFANTASVRDKDLLWVRLFRDVALHDNFSPHITLGYGDAPLNYPLPKVFQVGYLGLFQLGPFCSCYKEL